MRILFVYYEKATRELIREVHRLYDAAEKSEETAAGEAAAEGEADDAAEKSEETAAGEAAAEGEADDAAEKSGETAAGEAAESKDEHSKKGHLKPVIIIEPIRYISQETHKEKLVLYLYNNWKKPEDIINSVPYASIETDILNLRNSLPQINMYGAGFMATDVAKLRMLIEQRYRDFPSEYDDSQGLQSFIKDIALELYKECRKKDKGTFPNNGGLYCVPVTVFNETFEELYGTKNMKIDNDFDNRTVRSEMRRHGLTRCNTVENSYHLRVSGQGAKYMAFVINGVDPENKVDTAKNEENADD